MALLRSRPCQPLGYPQIAFQQLFLCCLGHVCSLPLAIVTSYKEDSHVRLSQFFLTLEQKSHRSATKMATLTLPPPPPPLLLSSHSFLRVTKSFSFVHSLDMYGTWVTHISFSGFSLAHNNRIGKFLVHQSPPSPQDLWERGFWWGTRNQSKPLI